MTAASAAAKIILFGEHAVVHGFPALAAPVSSVRATADITPASLGSGLRFDAPGVNTDMPAGLDAGVVDNAFALTVRLVLDAIGAATPDAIITVRSDIPIASGMGSGAAVSTAVARALCAHVGAALSDADLNAIVYEVEKLHHGTPSGIDNTVIVYEKPVYFVRGADPLPLTVGAPFDLMIADTGHPASTRTAVAGVRVLLNADPDRVRGLFDSIGQLVISARATIESGSSAALGALMIQNHAVLRDLTVSSAELDRLVDAALAAGALGAKMSGGGRGGIMIALIDDATRHTVAAALIRAGAVRILTTSIR
ncbi:MAG: mevalonate kinase [Chloroflexota bacterium]|nr:mevalonate kinase [Chloroflexota bacterium]